MKLFALVGLLFAALVLTAVPVSVQPTSSGWQLRADTANAQTYRRARVTYRRAYRRGARQTYRRAGYYAGGGYYGARRVCRCY